MKISTKPLSVVNLHQVMVGLGLPVAWQEKVALSGWTTVRFSGASMIVGATEKQWNGR